MATAGGSIRSMSPEALALALAGVTRDVARFAYASNRAGVEAHQRVGQRYPHGAHAHIDALAEIAADIGGHFAQLEAARADDEGVHTRHSIGNLTAAQAAAVLGVDPRTLRRWWAAGQGPEPTPGPGGRVVTPTALAQWLGRTAA